MGQDRSHVHLPLSEDASAKTIVRAVIDLAHSLDLRVVAEGDTPGELQFLQKAGRDLAQGFLCPSQMGPVLAFRGS